MQIEHQYGVDSAALAYADQADIAALMDRKLRLHMIELSQALDEHRDNEFSGRTFAHKVSFSLGKNKKYVIKRHTQHNQRLINRKLNNQQYTNRKSQESLLLFYLSVKRC